MNLLCRLHHSFCWSVRSQKPHPLGSRELTVGIIFYPFLTSLLYVYLMNELNIDFIAVATSYPQAPSMQHPYKPP